MLQWMGGSRRNVTASGKSTQKRQKQYFEQRKWRQHHEVTSVVNNQVDGSNNINQHQSNNRSLDILSLLNVPKVRENMSTYSTGDFASSADCHVWKSIPTINVDGIAPMSPVATSGKRGLDVDSGTPSGHNQVKALSERFLRSSSNSSNHSYEAKIDADCNISPSQCLSVFDLIGDDVTPEASTRSPTCEAHAEFSIEGLGKVGNDTPVHSPQQLCWASPSGRSSMTKAGRQLKSSKKFDQASDDLEIEIESFSQGDCLPFSCIFMDSGCKTGCRLDQSRGRKHEMSSVKDQLGCKSYKKSAFGATDFFNDVPRKHAEFRNGSSSLLHDRFLDEGDIAWKHAGFNNGFRTRNKNVPEVMLEASHLAKRYPGKATVTFDSLDLSGQYEKHETREDCGFATLDESSLYSWSCLIAKDERDSLNSFCKG